MALRRPIISLDRTTPLLDTVNVPADLRKLPDSELGQLADELRQELIDVVSHTGGHLGAGLGVVELTVALHYIFDTPNDLLVWDVGHQAYPHKILTGRRNRIRTLRQPGGLYGFTKRTESEYDPFGAAHSSTSISAALGMAAARDLDSKNHNVIAVIGDGAMSAGMAYEAMNNAGHLGKRLIVILNDNDMSISPPVGALSSYLNKVRVSPPLQFLSDSVQESVKNIPLIGKDIPEELKNIKGSVRRLSVPKVGAVFEELGFTYMGPIDGHDIGNLVNTFNAAHKLKKPVLVHVVTTKGKGYPYAEADQVGYHAQSAFDLTTGKSIPSKKPKPVSYSKIFGQTLLKICEQDSKVVGITAAMATGTGLDILQRNIPDQYIDVGIAEQHAVTLAAGMSCDGLKPVVAIYSTFLQRAFDQLIHDVGIQNLPVSFVLDRAGIVGADGPTHQGQYDISYMRSIPNFVLMAPKDESELQRMLITSINHSGPSALRIPRGSGLGVAVMDEGWEPLNIGEAEILEEGEDILIIAYGSMVASAIETAMILKNMNINACIVNARFVKPLDKNLIMPLASRIQKVVTMEEGTLIGGFGSAIVELFNDNEINIPVYRIGIPDVLVDHASPDQSKEKLGLMPDQMADKIVKKFKLNN